MKKDRLKRLEARMGPEAYTCILVDETDNPPSTINCPHAGREINLEDCLGFGGNPCPHSQNFIHIIWDMVE
jgi:hypothetical protein